MDTDQILLIMGLVLLLFFIFRHAHYTSVYTLTPNPTTTKSTTLIYRTPQVNSIFVTPGHYNAYKSQFYN